MEAEGRAIVLLSGGIDSAVALWWARTRYAAIEALTFDYHERAEREKRATADLAAAAGVRRLHRVDLPFLREAADMPPSVRRNRRLADAPPGYVPARNLVFYSLAAYHAEALGASAIVGGHHRADAARFPDASAAFFRRFEDLATEGVWSFRGSPVRVVLPLIGLAKEEVLRLAERTGTPLELTWSCYGDGPAPCGACASCVERRAAFADARLADPAASLA